MTTRSAPGRGRQIPPALLLAASIGLAPGFVGPTAFAAPWQMAPARQVVVFGVVATPGTDAMDAKIPPVVQAQLQKLMPGHGFRLVKVKSDRAKAGDTVVCDLGGGYEATAKMMAPMDMNGKVQMKFELSTDKTSQFQTIVTTPPDQFNYFDKPLPGGDRLLLGVGAR